jgi:MerR family transcriptional regulator, light-induced transcriptional regulator
MSLDEVNRKVLEISQVHNDATVHIDQLVIAMIDMEEEMFEKILNTMILRYGFEKSITEIIYPFLEKIGVLWQTHNISPAHEHFISNLIRQKVIVAIDGLPVPSKISKKVVLFLPEGEMHEIGLLFYHYLVRKSGLRSYYLGQNVPHDDLIQICSIHQPDVLVTSITSVLSLPIEKYFSKLSKNFPGLTILAAGAQVHRFKGLKVGNIQTFRNALELKSFI